MNRITSVCKKCILDKKEANRLPCLALHKDWEKGKKPKIKDILCRTGSFGWCPRFCGLPDRIFEMKVKQYLSQEIIKELEFRYQKQIKPKME